MKHTLLKEEVDHLINIMLWNCEKTEIITNEFNFKETGYLEKNKLILSKLQGIRADLIF